jgi:probable phosphoglycerate mutase
VAGQPVDERHVWLVRHGETEWARLGRHTGRTDIPLTERGRDQARALGRRLRNHRFDVVLTSPLSRAAETARLAGVGDVAIPDPDLLEWDYGANEGRTTPEIRADDPAWTIWTGPWPGGETPAQVGARADRAIRRLEGARGDALVFAHGHLLRVLAARWIGLGPESGGRFELATATVSILGWERETRTIELWNGAAHLAQGQASEGARRAPTARS